MKKIILSLVAVIMATGAYAHDSTKVKRSPEERANRNADKLKKELSLSDEQRSKVYTVFLDKANKSEAIKAKYKDNSDKKALKAEMKSLHENLDNSMKGILTADQYAKWQTIKADKKQKHKEKKGKGAGTSTP